MILKDIVPMKEHGTMKEGGDYECATVDIAEDEYVTRTIILFNSDVGVAMLGIETSSGERAVMGT